MIISPSSAISASRAIRLNLGVRNFRGKTSAKRVDDKAVHLGCACGQTGVHFAIEYRSGEKYRLGFQESRVGLSRADELLAETVKIGASRGGLVPFKLQRLTPIKRGEQDFVD